jgi:hypothetical protein
MGQGYLVWVAYAFCEIQSGIIRLQNLEIYFVVTISIATLIYRDTGHLAGIDPGQMAMMGQPLCVVSV